MTLRLASDRLRAFPDNEKGRKHKAPVGDNLLPTPAPTPAEELMAPVRDPNNVEGQLKAHTSGHDHWVAYEEGEIDQIKDVIENLFDVQSAVHGYLPETQGPLVEKMYAITEKLHFFEKCSPYFPAHFMRFQLLTRSLCRIDLTQSLSKLSSLASSPTNPIQSIRLPPEILDYVDGGRNPDVYTREFVEVVQRGNAVLNGKQDAFKRFSEIFAEELLSVMPETEKEVNRVMANGSLREVKQSGKD